DQCSDAEIKRLLEHFTAEDDAEDLEELIVTELRLQDVPELKLHVIDQRLEKIRERVGQHIRQQTQQQPIIKLRRRVGWKYLAIAASIAIIMGLGLYFYNTPNASEEVQLVMQNDIAPGKN